MAFDLGDIVKQGPFAWLMGAAGLGGGLFALMKAHAEAKPDMVEAGVSAMKATFEELRAEIDRMGQREAKLTAELSQLREDRHRLRNALGVLEAHVYQLTRYGRMLREELRAAGIDPPVDGMTAADIDQMLKGPIPAYRPDEVKANRGRGSGGL